MTIETQTVPLRLPWGDDPSDSSDGIPVASGDEDVAMTPAPGVVHAAADLAVTSVLATLTVGEKLAILGAVARAARQAALDVQVSAMPYWAPTAVHLQAADWRAFAAWLRDARSRNFVDFGLETLIAPMKIGTARYVLAALVDGIPLMVRLRAGAVLHLPFRE
jgi:hypothetical protein